MTAAEPVWATSFSAGAGVGPLLGGVLLEHLWWGSAFLPALPVMVLLLVLGPVLLPEFREPRASRSDLPSAALSLAAVLAVIYGLQQVAQDGAGWSPLLIVAGGLAIGAVIAVGTALLAATVREHLSPAGPSGRLADAGPIPAQHRSWARSPS